MRIIPGAPSALGSRQAGSLRRFTGRSAVSWRVGWRVPAPSPAPPAAPPQPEPQPEPQPQPPPRRSRHSRDAAGHSVSVSEGSASLNPGLGAGRWAGGAVPCLRADDREPNHPEPPAGRANRHGGVPELAPRALGALAAGGPSCLRSQCLAVPRSQWWVVGGGWECADGERIDGASCGGSVRSGRSCTL